MNDILKRINKKCDDAKKELEKEYSWRKNKSKKSEETYIRPVKSLVRIT